MLIYLNIQCLKCKRNKKKFEISLLFKLSSSVLMHFPFLHSPFLHVKIKVILKKMTKFYKMFFFALKKFCIVIQLSHCLENITNT